MTTAIIAGVWQLVLALGPTSSQAARELTGDDAVRLRMVLHVEVDSEDLALARDTAQNLLSAAGVQTRWSMCSALASTCGSSNIPGTITVRLLPTKVRDRQSCGHLVRDFNHGSTALVHVRRHEELARAVRNSSAGRSHPALSTLRTGYLLGLTMAHEVGHALGLPHGKWGVMKARADIEDLRALREARLAFTAEQSHHMRLTVSGDRSQLADSDQ